MALTPGTRIGPYEITGVLGAGGMGEVYRARDPHLNRDVAIKVLPASVADDPDRLARFTREAQTLAALNHPNIAQIYGFERTDHALIMELVEGEDLSALIANGARGLQTPGSPPGSKDPGLHLTDILPIARQIADALEAAHEQGIIHRDLKPANVKVRADGTVKVLDFGLAKALTPDSGSTADANNSPTLTNRATQLGVILGTAAYMAPEQAKGKAVDRRADIWAFGVVLYEMLTGRRAFEGEDVSTTLAAVLMRDPEWGALPADTPPALRTLVRRCLERDPKLRLRDIGEARILLSQPDTLRMTAPQSAVPATTTSAGRLRWVPWAAAVLIAAALGAWTARLFQGPPPALLPVRFAVATSTVASGLNLVFALSPDGRTLAYLAPDSRNSSTVIWVRPIDALQPRPLAGTESATVLFWATDNRRIGFVSAGKLKTVDITGGLPQTVADTSVGTTGGAWNQDGTILIATGPSATNVALMRVNEQGGTLTDVLQPDRALQQTMLCWPTFLPDGRHFLYLAWSNVPEKRAIYAGSLDGGPPTLITTASGQPEFMAPGTLFFMRDGSLMAQSFDPGRLRLSGDAVRVAPEVLYSRTNGRTAMTAARAGVIAFREGRAFDPIADLAWVNRAGQAGGTVGDPGAFNQVRLSPDEKRVVVSLPDVRTSGYNMWVLDLSNKIFSQVTHEETSNDPAWAPDSQSLAFEAVPKGKRDLYRQVIGTPTTTLLFESADDPKWLDDWSRDGKYLLFHLPRPGKIYAVPLEPAGKPMLLAETTANFDSVHMSPDGKWIAYGQNESGEYEVWVAAFPAFDHRRKVSAHGGGQPWWRGDSRELFYLSLDGRMMLVTMTAGAGGAADFSEPRELFQSPIARPSPTIDQYAVTRDGQRFLFIQPKRDQENPIAPITVVVNWSPVGK